MPVIRIHRHPHCARCRRIARTHRAFDWFGRIDDTTEAPSSGPVRMGEVLVNDLRSGRLHAGADAFDLICRQIPLYAPILPLLRVPAFRRMVERQMSGCDGGACEVPGD